MKWIGLPERRATRPKVLGAGELPDLAGAVFVLAHPSVGAAAAKPRREAAKRVLNCIVIDCCD